MQPTSQIVEHFFRHEYGRIVSHLAGKFGVDHLEEVEDAVQEALYKAMQSWPFAGVPSNSSAWILQVARNKLIDNYRKANTLAKKSAAIRESQTQDEQPVDLDLNHVLNDDLLKMLFACCDPRINEEHQVILALRILCGFSAKEVAQAFLRSEEAVGKTYQRAKEKLREAGYSPQVPLGKDLNDRLDSILKTLYLLFNEGYKASHGNALIRKDLCEEAIRLAELIVEDKLLRKPAVQSLLALMYFQVSRFDSRIDKDGKLLTLEEQDRSLWNKELINKGLEYIEKATGFGPVGEYYIQASMAACHCLAKDFQSTDWKKILALYDLNLSINPGKIVALNRLVAVARVAGDWQAFEELEKLHDETLEKFYLYHAIRGSLLATLQRKDEAKEAYRKASTLTDNQLEKAYLFEKAAKLS